MDGFKRLLRPGGRVGRYDKPQLSKGTISPPRKRRAEKDSPERQKISRFNGDLKGFNRLKRKT